MPQSADYDSDFDDDEDWADDDNELDESDTAPCPECGQPVEYLVPKCPACGYWILAADRQAMWPSTGTPMWVKLVAAIVLIAMLAAALLAFI